MQRSLEQRYAIKFCVKLGKSATETFDMIKQAYPDDVLVRSGVFRWHKAFSEGREEVADEDRAGRPSTSTNTDNVTRVRKVLNSDRRLSICLIAQMLNLSKSVVHDIVTEHLNMRKVCAKMVPKVLTDGQKLRRVEVCQENLNMCESDPQFLNNVITGDESWIFEYDPETKRQSSEWHTPASPRPKKGRMSKSKVKTMLIVFFDIKGIVHHEFVPPGQTVNAKFYVEVLKRLKRRVNRVRQDIAADWKLHHDNAPAHTAFLVNSYLTKAGIPTLPQPPYSPDVAPPDFFLFPRLKRPMKGKHFETTEGIQAACTADLKAIPENAFRDAFNAWKSRWQRCIDAEGAYFESF